MKSKFFLAIIFCFVCSSVMAMPGVDIGPIAIPQILEIPQISAAGSSTIPTPIPVVAPVAGSSKIGALPAVGMPKASSGVPAQYASESDILKAITEAASPSTPLFRDNSADKSKILIYQVILKSVSILLAKINFDTKSKILDGFLIDVLNPVIDSSTHLVTNSALDDIYAKLLGDPNKLTATVDADKYTAFFLINNVQSDLRKMSGPSVSAYNQLFNRIYTNLLSARSKLESQIKNQANFANNLDSIRALDSSKFLSKIDAYKNLIASVNKSITITSRNALILDIGRLIGSVDNDSDRQKVYSLFTLIFANKFFTNAEKIQVSDFGKAKSVATQGSVSAAAKPVVSSVAQPVGMPVQIVPVAIPLVPKVTVAVVGTNIVSVKAQLNAAGKNYDELIKVCSSAIDFMPKITNPNDKKTLGTLISDKIIILYNNRSLLKGAALNALIALFEKAKNAVELSSVITPHRLNSVKLMAQLNSASVEQDPSKKVAAYLQISNSIVKDIAHFELGRFVDGIASIFNLRKQILSDTKVDINAKRAYINALKDLLTYLNSAEFKAKNIFDAATQKAFASWLNIIQGTSVLFSDLEASPVKEQVAQLENILNNIAVADASCERTQLVMVIISQMYNSRGNYLKEDLATVRDLFVTIQNRHGLLAGNQFKTIAIWINEMDNAIKITDGKNTYISTLLNNAVNGKDLSLYAKIATLFTTATPVPVLATFVVALNGIFNARDSYDKTMLLNLFQMINQCKISKNVNLLSTAQRKVMNQWINILNQEITTR